MLESDKLPFAQMLATTWSLYGKESPSKDAMRVWFGQLANFDLHTVQFAFDRYVATEPKFPPTPGAIRIILGANLDHRPTADEAWAIALPAEDESETVVWTKETAEAYASCQSVLEARDKVGARMAFKGAYERLVASSRALGQPVEWVVSLGHDQSKRSASLERAVVAGLLPAPRAAALLPPPEPVAGVTEDAKAIENLAKIKAMMAATFRSAEQMQRDHEELVEQQRADVEQRKDELAAQAAEYAQRTGAA